LLKNGKPEEMIAVAVGDVHMGVGFDGDGRGDPVGEGVGCVYG